MFHRQKLYVTLAVSAGVVSGIGLFLYYRHRQKLASSKTTSDIYNRHYTTKTTTEDEQHESTDGLEVSTMDFLNGTTTLTAAQAVILTGYLSDYQMNNEGKLQSTLTTIANIGTFAENQIHLSNAGCIERLRELLSSNQNELTQRKILFALNNLALNETTIRHYDNFVPQVIELCQKSAAKSLLRLNALNLLTNMTVLEYLHDEFMQNITELSSLISITWTSNDEALAMARTLVNLSANKANLENLLKLTNIELKTIVNYCAAARRSRDDDEIAELEDILLRYLTFYCNVATNVVQELKYGTALSKSSFLDPKPHAKAAVYFELFDPDKQMTAKTILRPQYSSPTIHQYIRRLTDSIDFIRQIQFESSVSVLHDEFARSESIVEVSTPKKPSLSSGSNGIENLLEELEKNVDAEFEDDDQTILADGASSPSDQSRASFLSAVSTTDAYPISPDKPMPSENS